MIEEQVNAAIDVIISHAIKALKKGKKNSEIKLTALSMSIGRRVMNDPDYEDSVFMRVGDLFVESMFVVGYVNIVKPGGPRSRAPIQVVLNDTFSRIAPVLGEITAASLRCTVLEAPEPTSTMGRRIGNYKGPAIKGYKKNDPIDIDSVWVEALDKMQSVAWRVNRQVFEACLANAFRFITNGTDISESDKSKVMSFNYTIEKASLLVDELQFFQGMDLDYRGRYYTIEPSLQYQGDDLARGMLQFAEGKPMTDDGRYWLAVHTAASFNQSYHIDDLPGWLGYDSEGNKVRDYKAHLDGQELDSISVDKMHLDDQVEWVMQNYDTIYELGKSNEFWIKLNDDDEEEFAAEKPVAFLACCLEWAAYSEHDDDEGPFISHLPIPIDAHSSGWQHLGAMTHDEQTGVLVGLVGSEIPKDFYVSVAQGVISLANAGDEEVAEFLQGLTMKVIRKCITKRASMILAYSAGRGTLRKTIIEDSDQYGLIVPEHIAQSIADKVIETILEICPGPLRTMKFFKELAAYELGKFERYRDGENQDKEFRKLKNRRKTLFDAGRELTDEELVEISMISEELKDFEACLVPESGNGSKFITWTTPAGFPVKYEDYYTYSERITGFIAGYGATGFIGHAVVREGDSPMTSNFISGISPNIVHSMDSAQLALTCVRHSGTFAGIHDSFSTHACDVDELLHHAKETFIEMYEDGLFLENIKNEILSDDEFFEAVPPVLGNLDFNGIRESSGFFS